MKTNCENCGAVLKNNFCDYCGTDYREPLRGVSLPVIHCDSERLAMRSTIDPFYASCMDAEHLLEHVKSDMVKKLAAKLAETVKYKTYTDFSTQSLVIETFVDVAKRGSYWTE
jgi:recombinational DNA repair protein RecR